jgi:pSer/pThr/pTyr-binding forkhead associated (FHA) protein
MTLARAQGCGHPHGDGLRAPWGGQGSALWGITLTDVPDSPLQAHASSPQELKARIEAERRGTPFLLYRDGEGEQVIVDLVPLGERLTLGRRAGNDVVLGWDSEVSRVHAALERLGEAWTVVDDGLSHNGTYRNGVRVTSRERLEDGDTLALGGVSIAYRAPGGDGASDATVTALREHVGASITPAQRRVLIALCRPFKDAGYATPATNQQIADELVISVDAVKSTLRALFERFGVDGLPQNAKRAALATEALTTGVVKRRDL